MNQEVMQKKQKFDEFIKKIEINHIFESRDIIEHNVSIFETQQSIKGGQNAYFFIPFDDSIFNKCEIAFANLNNVNKKEQILELLNELNTENKYIKYILNPHNNDIISEFCLIGDANSFDAELFWNLIILAFQNIEDNIYKKIMRVIWS